MPIGIPCDGAAPAHAHWSAIRFSLCFLLFNTVHMSLCASHRVREAASSSQQLTVLTQKKFDSLKQRITFVLQHKDDTHQTIFEIALGHWIWFCLSPIYYHMSCYIKILYKNHKQKIGGRGIYRINGLTLESQISGESRANFALGMCNGSSKAFTEACEQFKRKFYTFRGNSAKITRQSYSIHPASLNPLHPLLTMNIIPMTDSLFSNIFANLFSFFPKCKSTKFT